LQYHHTRKGRGEENNNRGNKMNSPGTSVKTRFIKTGRKGKKSCMTGGDRKPNERPQGGFLKKRTQSKSEDVLRKDYVQKHKTWGKKKRVKQRKMTKG